jgi:DNA (cytosine-5)-methyltransferase 1
MENVPQVIGEKNLGDFISWRGKLESLGYSNYVEVLNAKDYGIPQNRQRCFMVSILGDYSYTFPNKKPLEKRLKDLLEDEVDESFYLSDKMMNYISANNEKWTGNNGESLVNKTIASTINTGEGSKRCDASNYISDDLPDNYNIKQLHKTLRETLQTNDIESIEDVAYIDAYNRNIRNDNIVGSITTRVDASNNSYVAVRKYGIFDKNGKRHQAGSVYDENGLSPTLDTMSGGWRQPCIEIKEATKKGYKEAFEGDGIDISGRMETHRGTVQKGMCQTLKTSIDIGVVVTTVCNPYYKSNLKIRKLTPKECFRLMGVRDEDYENIAKNQSNSKLYHLAGDSIVVDVLMAIFKEMML